MLTNRLKCDIILLREDFYKKFRIFGVHFAIFYVYICEGKKRRKSYERGTAHQKLTAHGWVPVCHSDI